MVANYSVRFMEPKDTRELLILEEKTVDTGRFGFSTSNNYDYYQIQQSLRPRYDGIVAETVEFNGLVGVGLMFFFLLLLGVLLTGCAPSKQSGEITSAGACSVTEPGWVKPPEDSAVSGTPEYGYYWVNEDRSIWASAWWTDQDEKYLRAGEEGVKVGWFRPAGAELIITGQRIDSEAPPLEAHVPCCYPTRFQATGLYFPTEGCWEITATAADSVLTFVTWVEP